MNRDFYTTLAQVLPVLLLTIVWDRHYLDKLRTRQPRSADPNGVRFWTKPVVRPYFIGVAAVLLAAIGACVLVLADVLADDCWLRVALIAATGIALATLFVRIAAEIIDATPP